MKNRSSFYLVLCFTVWGLLLSVLSEQFTPDATNHTMQLDPDMATWWATIGSATNMANTYMGVVTNNDVRIEAVAKTNWTGYIFEGRELGVVITNLTVFICYRGSNYEHVFDRDASNLAVWRDQPFLTNLAVYYYQLEPASNRLNQP